MSRVIRLTPDVQQRLLGFQLPGENAAMTITRIMDIYQEVADDPTKDFTKTIQASQFMPQLQQAFDDIYQTIAMDLTAPGASMSREDLFSICCDHLGNGVLADTPLIWWRAQTYEYQQTLIPKIFDEGFYEVGDNEGFGPDGVMT
jgi:hypothetical protein